MRRCLAPLCVLGLLLGLPAGTAAGFVTVEVSTVAGVRLGRLVGEPQGAATYFLLADVARLTSASMRRAAQGDRMSLVSRHGVVQMTRDSRVITVDGRPVSLSAPVRVRQGTWRVPSDLLGRALPALVGTGVRMVSGETREVRGAAMDGGKPVVGPAVASAPRVEAKPAVAPPPPAALDSLGDRPPTPRTSEPPAPRPLLRPAAPSTARVELRVRSYPTYTRLVLEADAPLDPRLVETEGGLTVTFPDVSPRGWTGTRTVRDGLVSTAEFGEARGSAALRVAFERPPAARKVFRLEDPPRVVLDFQRQTPRAAAPAPGATGPEPLHTIVIDPGHGGHDAGAIGPTGLQEKELALDLARRVGVLLQDELGVRVVLTRGRDQFVGLRERTALANRERADLFLSIHVNAAPDGTATGTETYFLSNEATDGAARRAAEYENRLLAADTGARGGPPDVLRSILWDLAQSDFQQESSRAAEALQNNLDRALRRPSRGVKQAPFYVLGGAAMPAVLVEIGFISNPQEEQRLRDDGYRDRIARALAAGVTAYKRSYDQRAGVLAKR